VFETGKEFVEAIEHRFWLQHHPGSTPERLVVHAAPRTLCKGPKIMEKNLKEALLLGYPDDAFPKETLEDTGENRQNIYPHLRTSFQPPET
jgi:hypothetical protein